MIRNNKFFVKKYDEDENKITLEEERKYHSPFVLFLIKNGRLLLAISLLLSVSVFIIAITLIFGNMKESSIVMYEQNGVVVSFDGDDNSIVNGTPITKEYAEKVFDSNLIQDNNLRGVVIKLKEVSIKDKNKGKVKGVITFYSDRTAIVKYDDGSYKRIYSVNGNYGITKSGVIDSKAITNDLSGEYKKNDKYNINLIYLSDGSVIVIKDKVELFVRNSDITSNDDEFSRVVFDYIENPTADTFVNIHEDFYQEHKMEDYNFITDKDLLNYDLREFVSYKDVYGVIRQNKEQLKETLDVVVTKFKDKVFTEEQKQLIPNLGEEFELPEQLKPICNAVVNGDSKTVLLHGPAGTGKTISCKLICRDIGLPIMDTVNCSENLDEFILGKFIPEGDQIVFKESFVTKAIRDGGAVVFEEINFAKPAYLAFLNSLLDDNGFVRLDNGEIVRRNPNFRFFATMNLGYFGTKELNKALQKVLYSKNKLVIWFAW